ncbi:diphthine synthase [Methanobrevibacter curvatus]|uniref:Diphthine synthase n=1 Tax=Methanobrevibacter curvatus TaxID=49547 RepID=A0A162FFC4_9EURY|nr:diphthine synthase [Methanobrevibacter curvatus]KZX12275.1 diphthine synthase [Methanobrevibacter curvatus]
MLYFVGLGLFDIKDISIKGLDTLKKADKIYAEFFTSKLFGSSIEAIEELIAKKIIILNRQEVEEDNLFFNDADKLNVALITGGDPLIATTHTDFLVEAKNKGIDYEVIHGSSILSAAPGLSGLQAYKFGKVTTIPFPDENFFPKSPYLNIISNLKNNAHTLVLLDIQAHKNRYMTINQGLKYLMKINEDLKNDLNKNLSSDLNDGLSSDLDESNQINSKNNNEAILNEESLVIGIARAGSPDVLIKAGKIKDLIDFDFGGPLHCLVIPSKLHIVEGEYLVSIAGANKDILDDL